MSDHDLKPYDPDAACPRCGRTPVGTRSCDYTRPPIGGFDRHWPIWVYVVGGHLHRTCGRCDYEWIELAITARMMTDEEIEIVRDLWKKAADRYREERWPDEK